MNFDYSKIKSLSNADLATITFTILMGANIVQKGRKLINMGEDPRTIPAYKEIFDDIQTQIPAGFERPASNIMEAINLEIQFEVEDRKAKEKSYFGDITIEKRVNSFFNTCHQAELNEEEVYF